MNVSLKKIVSRKARGGYSINDIQPENVNPEDTFIELLDLEMGGAA
jgi:hypothetical protein